MFLHSCSKKLINPVWIFNYLRDKGKDPVLSSPFTLVPGAVPGELPKADLGDSCSQKRSPACVKRSHNASGTDQDLVGRDIVAGREVGRGAEADRSLGPRRSADR